VKPKSIWRIATSSFAIAFLISACAGGSGFLSGGDSFVVNGNFRGIADCTFGKIRMAQATGLTQSVVPGEQKILVTLATGGSQNWEMTFTPAGGATNVSISASLSSGPYPADKAAQAARSCAAR
jgi:hypothetical protein